MITTIIGLTAGPQLALPGSYWLVTFLQWVTFGLHLIAMNVLVGGLLVLIISPKGPVQRLLFDDLTKILPTTMAATISLGVAPLLFTQLIYGDFFYSASIVSGWQWLSLVPVLLLVYYLLYSSSMMNTLPKNRRIILLSLAAIGLAYISYTFTAISDLAEKPELWVGLYLASPAGCSTNPEVLELIFRWGHMLAGALATAGMVCMLFSLFHSKVAGDKSLLLYGARIFFMGIIKAAFLAIVYLFLIPREVLSAFLQSAGFHAIAGAIVITIIAAIMVYRSIASTRPRILVLGASLLIILGIYCMVIGRHYLRLVYLEDIFDPTQLPISFQMGPFIMFAVTFVIGLAVLAAMLHVYFHSRESETQ